MAIERAMLKNSELHTHKIWNLYEIREILLLISYLSLKLTILRINVTRERNY